MTIYAQYFDGKTSSKSEVAIKFLEDDIVHIFGEGVDFKIALEDISFSMRVANTPRVLTFPNGSVAYSDDNDKIDTILKNKRAKLSYAYIFESKSRYALLSFILLIVTIWFFLTSGSDILARSVANITPYSIEKEISKRGLEVLDEYMLQPSKLSEKEKNRLSKLFMKITDNEKKYHLHFRRGVGENAFALPSGDIVITDELVEFADGDYEMIYGVLAHERGHVEFKHSMQMIIKASAVSVIVTYFTGDVSSLVASLGTSLISSNYSREYEREADRYAKSKMIEANISPKHLADFFIKMQKKSKDSTKHGYFDSHPSNSERIEYLLN